MPAEHDGAAARARTAAFYPLFPGIVQQTAAIRVVFQQQTLCCQQLPQHLTAHQPKVAGVDAVEIPQFCMGIGKIMQQGGGCCRCHGCAHVVDILDVIVLHPAKGCGGNAHPLPCRTQQAAPGGGGRPLRGRGAHRAIAQRGAELTFCRAEMAGGHGQQILRRPAAAQRRAQRQRLRHGAARPEQPRKGHAQLPQRVAGGGALRL